MHQTLDERMANTIGVGTGERRYADLRWAI